MNNIDISSIIGSVIKTFLISVFLIVFLCVFIKCVQNFTWYEIKCFSCFPQENQNQQHEVVWCFNCHKPVFESHKRSCNARNIAQLESTSQTLNRQEENVSHLPMRSEVFVVQLPTGSIENGDDINDGLPTYEEAVSYQY